jgi:nucleotide-binding universal stress UspA family protein
MKETLLSRTAQVTKMLTQDVEQIAIPILDSERQLRRVLVAFDGSAGAWAALDRGVALALSSHALLTIAGVVGSPPPIACGMIGVLVPPYTPEEFQRELDIEMEQTLAAARDEIPASISVTTVLLHGKASHALARLAEDGGYDLVVTGPRRIGRLGRLVHRSVTHSLLSRGTVSVLAVKPT